MRRQDDLRQLSFASAGIPTTLSSAPLRTLAASRSTGASNTTSDVHEQLIVHHESLKVAVEQSLDLGRLSGAGGAPGRRPEELAQLIMIIDVRKHRNDAG